MAVTPGRIQVIEDVLRGVAEALAQGGEPAHALDAALRACLDAGELSAGMLLRGLSGGPVRLHGAGDRLHLPGDPARAVAGYQALLAVLGRGAGVVLPSDAVPTDESVRLLAMAEATSAVAVPLVHRGVVLGGLFLFSRAGDLVRRDRRLFAEAVAGQMALATALADAFEERTQLVVGERMAAVGTLAAGVAHEINNPLAALVTNLELAVKDVDALSRELGGMDVLHELAEELDDARNAAEHVRRIVRDLRSYAQPDGDRRTAVDVRRVLDWAARMAWNDIRHRARLVKDYGDVPCIDASEAHVGQLFLTLITGAARAVPVGQADRHELRLVARLGADGRVLVEVCDTGAGVAPGAGPVRSFARRLAAVVGGELEVYTTSGTGTCVRVRLPVTVDVPAAPSHEVAPVPAPARRRARVLVIDDEDSVRHALRRLLARAHDTVAVASAGEALQRIAAGERFDVILCDLMMPVMTGQDFVDVLGRMSPSLAARVVFLTGGAFTARECEFLAGVPNARIDKPFEGGDRVGGDRGGAGTALSRGVVRSTGRVRRSGRGSVRGAGSSTRIHILRPEKSVACRML